MVVVEIEYVASDSLEIVVHNLKSVDPTAIEMVMTLFDQMVIREILEVG